MAQFAYLHIKLIPTWPTLDTILVSSRSNGSTSWAVWYIMAKGVCVRASVHIFQSQFDVLALAEDVYKESDFNI